MSSFLIVTKKINILYVVSISLKVSVHTYRRDKNYLSLTVIFTSCLSLSVTAHLELELTVRVLELLQVCQFIPGTLITPPKKPNPSTMNN